MKITDPTSLLIAARIRRHRINSMGYTLTTAAAELPPESKLSAALLGRIENGTRAATTTELAEICQALDITFDALTRAGELCTHCGQEITR